MVVSFTIKDSGYLVIEGDSFEDVLAILRESLDDLRLITNIKTKENDFGIH